MDPAPQVHRTAAARHRSAGLFARLCTLHVRPLDRARPMWEQHVYTGLTGGRVALYFKTTTG